jgi:hypothetical protein
MEEAKSSEKDKDKARDRERERHKEEKRKKREKEEEDEERRRRHKRKHSSESRHRHSSKERRRSADPKSDRRRKEVAADVDAADESGLNRWNPERDGTAAVAEAEAALLQRASERSGDGDVERGSKRHKPTTGPQQSS